MVWVNALTPEGGALTEYHLSCYVFQNGDSNVLPPGFIRKHALVCLINWPYLDIPGPYLDTLGGCSRSSVRTKHVVLPEGFTAT